MSTLGILSHDMKAGLFSLTTHIMLQKLECRTFEPFVDTGALSDTDERMRLRRHDRCEPSQVFRNRQLRVPGPSILMNPCMAFLPFRQYWAPHFSAGLPAAFLEGRTASGTYAASQPTKNVKQILMVKMSRNSKCRPDEHRSRPSGGVELVRHTCLKRSAA